jgi:hypothetical protein
MLNVPLYTPAREAAGVVTDAPAYTVAVAKLVPCTPPEVAYAAFSLKLPPEAAAQAVAEPDPCLIAQLVFADNVSPVARLRTTVLGKANVTVLVLKVAVTEAPLAAATVPVAPDPRVPSENVVPAEARVTAAETVALTVTFVACARTTAGAIATTTNAYFVSDLMLNIVNLLEAPASGSD